MDTRGLCLLFFGTLLPAQVQIQAVTTGAGFLPGITRPGGVSTVFCRGLAGITGIQQANGFPLPKAIAGASVIVNGIVAPLLAVADLGTYQQINFIVPNLPDFTRAPIAIGVVQFGNGTGIKLRDNPFNGYPADFFRDASGYGIVRHSEDSSLVTVQNPARRGEVVTVYATGMGEVEPPVPAGTTAEAPSAVILYPGESGGLKVFLCRAGAACFPTQAGFYTSVLFAGLSSTPGVYQIKFQIPEGAPTGDDVELGVVRTYCYDGPCTIISPFQQNFESQRVKIPIR